MRNRYLGTAAAFRLHQDVLVPCETEQDDSSRTRWVEGKVIGLRRNRVLVEGRGWWPAVRIRSKSDGD